MPGTVTEQLISLTRRLGSRPGLSRVTELLRRLGDPQEGPCIIHVTGTNGKGSTACCIYRGLLACGLRAGLFSSPEIFCPNERISAMGREITDEEMDAQAARILPVWQEMAAEGGAPTEFETFVCIALLHFAAVGVTHLVMEVGMGGKRDATNVFSHTAACVFAPISVDHAKVLGSTVSAIAEEKSGILRPGCVAVSAHGQSPEAEAVLRTACAGVGTELCTVSAGEIREIRLFPDRTEFCYRGRPVSLPMGGDFQVQNAALAAETLWQLAARRPEIVFDRALPGFREARLHGRFERVLDDPEVYFDAGHNPAGNAALLSALDRHLPGRKLVTVMAMYKDKDYSPCIANVAARSAAFFATEADSPRALDSAAVAAVAERTCGQVTVERDPAEAARRAVALARSMDAAVLICGSFGHLARAAEGLK